VLLLFDKSFTKSLKKVKDNTIKQRILQFIDLIKKASSIQEISSVKKIKGFNNYYRYRFGDYRIGFRLEESNVVILIVIAKRNDIYKQFPLK